MSSLQGTFATQTLPQPGFLRLRPVADPAVVGHELDDELVLFDSRTSEVRILNSTAVRVWTLCDGEHTVDRLVTCLAEAFGITRSQAASDVTEFLTSLEDAALITFIGS